MSKVQGKSGAAQYSFLDLWYRAYYLEIQNLRLLGRLISDFCRLDFIFLQRIPYWIRLPVLAEKRACRHWWLLGTNL